MNTYDVTVSREDELWVADIAGMTDADPGELEIRWHHRAGDDVTALIGELAEVEAADTATAKRNAVRLEIIRRLSAAGLSQRVIVDVLGLPHQRVNQLANAS